MIKHPYSPLYNENSRVLILESFPSIKSRENLFFYGHTQNRFWKVISIIVGWEIPETIEEKKKLILDNKLAIWDVIASCEVTGSSDSSIKNVVPNDLSEVLNNANIERIFVNGRIAEKYYKIYIKNKINREAIFLPSTSPANAAWSLERLVEAWSVIR